MHVRGFVGTALGKWHDVIHLVAGRGVRQALRLEKFPALAAAPLDPPTAVPRAVLAVGFRMGALGCGEGISGNQEKEGREYQRDDFHGSAPTAWTQRSIATDRPTAAGAPTDALMPRTAPLLHGGIARGLSL